jgi:hypothetical protein
MECYLATQNEILSFEAKRMDDIMLCEIRQTQKDKYYVFSHMWKLKTVNLNVE